MIVEARGANTHNKGAELMLRSIARRFGPRDDVAVDTHVGSYAERSRLGLHQLVPAYGGRRPLVRSLTRPVPRKLRDHLRNRFGIVLDADVEAVLDASGFAYTDQFDQHRLDLAVELSAWAKATGRPFVLLPQAFGPFELPERRAAFVELVDNSSLVFAREQQSLDYVLASGARTDHVRLAPDFTCALDGELPADFGVPERLGLVVPSAKLLTHADPSVREAYLPFCALAARTMVDAGLDTRVLVHERTDADLVEPLLRELGSALPVISDPSAVRLKGVIGAATLVVGSRFHALVSALSQGVPSLAVGWSHKYRMLFEGYGCGENVIGADIAPAALAERVAALVEPGRHAQLTRQLRAEAEREVARTAEMWTAVDAALGRRP